MALLSSMEISHLTLLLGPLLGFQMVHTAVQLHDLQVAPGTSLPMITACAAQSVVEAVKKAKVCLLEPYMSVEVGNSACLL